MATQPPGDYEPSASPKTPTTEAQYVTVAVLRCPNCAHVCRARDLEPLLDKLCPKCFRAAVAKAVPEMEALTVTVPADPDTAAIEPKPGTTAYVALNRGDETEIETERMTKEQHTVYRREKQTGRTVATSRYRQRKAPKETTAKTTKPRKKRKKP